MANLRYRPSELAKVIKSIEAAGTRSGFPNDSSLVRSCLNCCMFAEQTEACGMANPPQRPPARVIAFGCNAHQDINDIPF